MLDYFNGYYQVKTTKDKANILNEIFQKIDAQKDKGIFSFGKVSYHNIQINDDTVEIKRTRNILSPFRGIGTIYFDFVSSKDGAIVKCRIEPLYKFRLKFASLFLLLFTIGVLFVSTDSYLNIAIYILFIWTIGLGFQLMSFMYNRTTLTEYSMSILSDLNISTLSISTVAEKEL